MEGNYFYIKQMNHDTFANCHRYVDDTINRLLKDGKIVAVKVEEYKHPRSLSANALYWMWMEDLAKLFNSKGMTIDGKGYDKEDCHDLCRSMFLGYVEKTLSKTHIKTLKSTRTLDTNQFCHYLRQIEQWSIEKLKHVLPDPADNQYRKWEQKQNE